MLLRLYVNIIDKLNVVVTAIVGALLGVVALAVMTQVLVRFVLTALNINISAPWTEELARYTLIWMVFLGAAVGVRHARMIALEFGVRKLPAQTGVPVRYAVMILSIAFFGLLFMVGIEFVELGKSETSPVLGITRDAVYWAMPVGMVLMILNSLALIAETILEGRDIRFASDFAPED
ncbi:TRAP transporter small permease [Tateyamaria pelophila]|uniref:TRAP transporter small permease n=1 Tax=Tateyamaria pelophila TaxID=328415 RepID=UPI001CBEDE61|nr:TRAP transporter small permease [Tateyamaria pelophila]